MNKNLWKSAIPKDFFYMLFVLQMSALFGTPGKYDWFKMNKKEKKKWRKLADNFKYLDEDPDWME